MMKKDILMDKTMQGMPVAGKKDAGNLRMIYIESYGCQMNFADSEVVASIMSEKGYGITGESEDADVIFINTCSIRDNAEKRIRRRLDQLKKSRNATKPGALVGVLGCMAERLKHRLLEEEGIVDIVAGPDAYRDLPQLVKQAEDGRAAVNVLLSREETYADINPVRLQSNGISAFVSIMRGCNNMCAFCVVPFTRGRERSRNMDSICREIEILSERNYREVTLLGQNVDSYHWRTGNGLVDFAQLLDTVAVKFPRLRIRFSTSHPKDMTDEVLSVMASHENICRYIHLPVQSGSSAVLNRMGRGYTRDWYLKRIDAIVKIMPDCAISTDIIAGFCGESEAEHEETLSLMEHVRFNFAYMFMYSERPGTLAARKFHDDVPEEVKKRRLSEIIGMQNEHSLALHQSLIGTNQKVLIEGQSKRSDKDWSGRNSQNAVVVFPAINGMRTGDEVNVTIRDCTSATLLGTAVKD